MYIILVAVPDPRMLPGGHAAPALLWPLGYPPPFLSCHDFDGIVVI